MSRYPQLILSIGLALTAACASARPDFEQEFFASNRATHDAWYRLLGTRYGCDTVVVRNAGSGYAGTQIAGTPVCTAAALVTPERIRAWRDSSGLREDWEFVGGSAHPQTISILGPSSSRTTLGRCVMQLVGEREERLKVNSVHC